MEIRVRKSYKRRKILALLVISFIIYGVFTLSNIFKKPKIVPPKDVLAEATQIGNEPTKLSLLPKIIADELTGTKGTYGIVIVNLKTGERYLTKEHKVYKSASLYKLWVMGTVFDLISQGKLSETTVISESIESLNKKFGLESLVSPTVSLAPDQPTPEASPSAEVMLTYTVGEALTKMITISDNYAALLLSSEVGLSNVDQFLKKNDFIQSKLGGNGGYPSTTASDIALFFIKLYKGDLANPEYTHKMLDLLKGQRLNGKIPKYLPQEIVVAHKTGELDEVTHDAGIVYALNGDYLIVILSESTSRVLAEERISNISKAVYNYFTSETGE